MTGVILGMAVVLLLVNVAAALYMLVQLHRARGIGNAILGFLFPPYLYIWGWMNGSRDTGGFFRNRDMMLFWTFAIILTVGFQGLVFAGGLLTAVGEMQIPQSPRGLDGGQVFTSSGSSVHRGSISVGGEVTDDLTELFEPHDWTFSGQAGQQVTIRCAPQSGANTDPTIDLIGPGGESLTEDDDGGGGRTALISGYSLPASGTYKIRVDVWTTGPYTLSLN
jgi:hypothetical protein